MGAAGRRIHFALWATVMCLAASGCIYSGSQTAMFDCAEPPCLPPVTIPRPRFVTPVPAPAGFSSTYQKHLVDHQRHARLQAEHDAQAKAAGRNTPEKEARLQNRE